jgi:hypothetical protein
MRLLFRWLLSPRVKQTGRKPWVPSTPPFPRKDICSHTNVETARVYLHVRTCLCYIYIYIYIHLEKVGTPRASPPHHRLVQKSRIFSPTNQHAHTQRTIGSPFGHQLGPIVQSAAQQPFPHALGSRMERPAAPLESFLHGTPLDALAKHTAESVIGPPGDARKSTPTESLFGLPPAPLEIMRSSSGEAVPGRAMSVADIEAQLLSGATAQRAPQPQPQMPMPGAGMHANHNNNHQMNNSNVLGMSAHGAPPGMGMQNQQQNVAGRQMNVPPLLQQMQAAHMQAFIQRQQHLMQQQHHLAQNFPQVCLPVCLMRNADASSSVSSVGAWLVTVCVRVGGSHVCMYACDASSHRRYTLLLSWLVVCGLANRKSIACIHVYEHAYVDRAKH